MSILYRIPVRLKPRPYEILIGRNSLNQLGPLVRPLHLGTHPVLLTNPTLLQGHARAVFKALSENGFPVQVLTAADTERSKSMPSLTRLLTQLADLDGPGRSLFLVLVGGGVVGDLGGLAAGLYRRGIPYIQVPTTLLSQVDSSIGGKTGVDLPHGKNLVGLFNQPHFVFTEMGFLRTLPDRQFRSGLAEVVKCGIIRDSALFSFLEKATVSSLRRREDSLAWLIARSARVKVAVVEADERETKGIRTILNFGHTFGHALEAATGYTAYAHGEAVALGMTVAARIACRLEMISFPTAERIENLIRRFGCPTTPRKVKLARILLAMSHDKKWKTGRNLWVLPTRIGRGILHQNVPRETVQSAIQSILEER